MLPDTAIVIGEKPNQLFIIFIFFIPSKVSWKNQHLISVCRMSEWINEEWINNNVRSSHLVIAHWMVGTESQRNWTIFTGPCLNIQFLRDRKCRTSQIILSPLCSDPWYKLCLQFWSLSTLCEPWDPSPVMASLAWLCTLHFWSQLWRTDIIYLSFVNKLKY